MKLKSPSEPVFLSEKSFNWLEAKLKRNELRKNLNKYEKELCSGAKKLQGQARSFL